MIKKKGDLFTSTAAAIGHGVNCKGQMGAGIAVAFKEKFPKNYELYRNACGNGLLKPGEAMINKEADLFICNLSTQDNPGRDATYERVMYATVDAALQLEKHGVHVLALPLIGCGIGGLEWEGVEIILKAVEIIVSGFEFEVWKL